MNFVTAVAKLVCLVVLITFCKYLFWAQYNYPFQSYSRDLDFTMTRALLTRGDIHRNDKLCVVGTYDFHILSSKPSSSLNYAAIIKPYSGLLWSLIGTSFALILLIFILIDKVSSSIIDELTSTSFHTSKKYSL